MPDPAGFSFIARKSGDVVITHYGRVATVLRGDRAAKFLAAAEEGEAQELMARLTGNYKRGNERA